MVLGYLIKEPELKAIIENPAEPLVDVYKKSTNETFQFRQPIIDVLIAIGTDGKDAASITKDQIVAYGRQVLLGAAETVDESPVQVSEDDEQPLAPPAPAPAPVPAPPAPVAAPARPAPPRPPVVATPPLRAPTAPAAVARPLPAAKPTPSTPESPEELTDQHLKNSSGVLIFQLLCGAKQIAKEHDRATGHEARLQKIEALWKEYAVFVKT